jgi:hypothetical protein
MFSQRYVVRLEKCDVRDAHRAREALEASLQQCQHQKAELRLTIMKTRIRLAEVTATVRRMPGSVPPRQP